MREVVQVAYGEELLFVVSPSMTSSFPGGLGPPDSERSSFHRLSSFINGREDSPPHHVTVITPELRTEKWARE